MQHWFRTGRVAVVCGVVAVVAACSGAEPARELGTAIQPLELSGELPFPGSASARPQTAPTVVADPAGFLLVWLEDEDGGLRTALATRVRTDGTFVDAAPVPLATGLPPNAALAATSGPNGARIVVPCPGGGSLCTVPVRNGAPTSPPTAVSAQLAADDLGFALASRPEGDVLVYSPSTTDPLLATLLLPDGGVQPGAGTPVFAPRVGLNPSVSCQGSACVVCFYDVAGAMSDVTCRQLDANLQPVLASTSNAGCCPAADSHPAVTWSDGGGFVIWEDAKDPAQTIYGSPLDTAGKLTVSEGMLLSATAPAPDQANPTIADDGANFWVAWESDAGEVWVETLDRTGAALELDSFPGAAPRLAFTAPGRGVLVYGVDAGSAPSVRLRVLGECANGGCASMMMDAGTPDAGLSDAGVADAGEASPPAPTHLEVGCGCIGAGTAAPAVFVFFALTLMLSDSRARKRARSRL